MVGSVGEGVAEGQAGLGVESRDLTQIGRSRERLCGSAVLMKQTLVSRSDQLGHGLN
jgi:hypothetical protein